MLDTNVIRYGSHAPLPEQRVLQAGPLSLVYEAGDLRYIRLGTREVLRRIYVAVRDRNWGTVPAHLSNLKTGMDADAFQITYDAEHRQREIDFYWRATISGDQRGTITFTMDGEARSTFARNRIGFCVLHPIRECAGLPCVVEHSDGALEAGAFPDRVAPNQPFVDIQAITHEVMPGLAAEVRFTGDSFEMEDQRNWTDASYKTYSTPLRLPYPVEVPAGTRIKQTVTLALTGELPDQRLAAEEQAVSFTIARAPIRRLPRIGLGAASDGRPLSGHELDRLRALRPAHLRLEVRLAEAGYAGRLRQVAGEARALGVPLHVALILSDDARDELIGLLGVLEQVRPDVQAWLIFHAHEKSTGERWVRLAREILLRYDAQAMIGGGTDAYFAELNRGHPAVEALDFASYSINPQVHAFDNASLVETLEAQAATIESARHLIDPLPLWISPITLKPRFNPDATGPEPRTPGELPPQVDPRQMSLFAAGWTAGSLKVLAEHNVEQATFYETAGWRGVMERTEGSPLPERFPSLPGSVFPLYHVLADACELAEADVLPARSSRALHVDGIVLRQGTRLRIMLANMSNALQVVAVRPIGAQARVRELDERSAVEAMLKPEAFRTRHGTLLSAEHGVLHLTLRPYAVVCIETTAPESGIS